MYLLYFIYNATKHPKGNIIIKLWVNSVKFSINILNVKPSITQINVLHYRIKKDYLIVNIKIIPKYTNKKLRKKFATYIMQKLKDIFSRIIIMVLFYLFSRYYAVSKEISIQ